MGMFDTIICNYRLPGNPPEWAWGASFQTKDLNCVLDTFVLNPSGQIVHEGLSDFHLTAKVVFYTNNIVASGPGIYTRNGEDAHELEYEAVFVRGWLHEIVELKNEKTLALKFNPKMYEPPSQEEQDHRRSRREESLVGRIMCLWWGGQDSGEMVKVVAENASELVMQYEVTGKFTVLDRGHRDSIFFDSYEDGKRNKEERETKWERERAEYKAAVVAKSAQG